MLLLNISLLAVIFLLSGLFSGTETALFSLSKIEKRRIQERHPHLSKWVLNHLDHPRRTLVTILISNQLVNTLGTTIVTLSVMHLWGPKAIGPSLAAFTIILILFFEIIPKTFAVRENERFSLVVSPFLEFFARLLFPLRVLVRMVSDRILKILIPHQKEHADQISEEELKTLVKLGEEEGVLDKQEHYMLQKLLELGERPVKEIMTPRISVIGMNIEDSRAEHLELIKKCHYTHFPVFQGTIDNVLGMVSVQEYVLKPEISLSALLKQPLFVPDLKRIDDLLAEFRQKTQSFAVCVDEYGGTAGIVTLEDIFEEIFGEFYDEYAKVENPIRALGHHEFLVEAKISLAQFNEYFSASLESEAASTLGGFILEKLGEVPEKGKVVSLPDCEIRIHDVIRQRLIRSVIVRPAS